MIEKKSAGLPPPPPLPVRCILSLTVPAAVAAMIPDDDDAPANGDANSTPEGAMEEDTGSLPRGCVLLDRVTVSVRDDDGGNDGDA